jgi:hypothetical protein
MARSTADDCSILLTFPENCRRSLDSGLSNIAQQSTETRINTAGQPLSPAVSSGKQFVRPDETNPIIVSLRAERQGAGALDRARKMPPVERTEAMNKATILENAAEILEYLFGKVGASAK